MHACIKHCYDVLNLATNNYLENNMSSDLIPWVQDLAA